MRRIGRWMINGLTVLSLVLCVGTCVLWVATYVKHSPVLSEPRNYSGGTWWVGARGGKAFYREEASAGSVSRAWITATVVDGKNVPVTTPVPVFTSASIGVTQTIKRPFPGITWTVAGTLIPMSFGPPDRTLHSRELVVKLWLPCLVFALAPALWLGLFARARHRRPGCCRSCSYDLTGNISGVCPECGMAVADRSSKGAASRAEERAPHPPCPGPLP